MRSTRDCASQHTGENSDEKHAWVGLSFSSAENSYARNLRCRHLGYACISMKARPPASRAHARAAWAFPRGLRGVPSWAGVRESLPWRCGGAGAKHARA